MKSQMTKECFLLQNWSLGLITLTFTALLTVTMIDSTNIGYAEAHGDGILWKCALILYEVSYTLGLVNVVLYWGWLRHDPVV